MSKTLTFNGKTFASIKAKALGNCHGYYSLKKNGVSLYKETRELEAFVVSDARQGRFVVSASNGSGKPFYMHSACSTTEAWLGISGMKSQQLSDCIQSIQFSE
jgi:hypothetical protein